MGKHNPYERLGNGLERRWSPAKQLWTYSFRVKDKDGARLRYTYNSLEEAKIAKAVVPRLPIGRPRHARIVKTNVDMAKIEQIYTWTRKWGQTLQQDAEEELLEILFPSVEEEE